MISTDLLHHLFGLFGNICILVQPFSVKAPQAKQLTWVINLLNRFACMPQVSSVQHLDPSPGYPPLDCPTVMGYKDLSMWSSGLQLTLGQVMMRPWLSNHDCCQMQVVQGLRFRILDERTLHWASLYPYAAKQSSRESGC